MQKGKDIAADHEHGGQRDLQDHVNARPAAMRERGLRKAAQLAQKRQANRAGAGAGNDRRRQLEAQAVPQEGPRSQRDQAVQAEEAQQKLQKLPEARPFLCFYRHRRLSRLRTVKNKQ